MTTKRNTGIAEPEKYGFLAIHMYMATLTSPSAARQGAAGGMDQVWHGRLIPAEHQEGPQRRCGTDA